VEIARHIQHTLIATGATRSEVVRHCEECLRHGFDAAMVSGLWVPLARQILAGSGVKVASAVDFPIAMMSGPGKVCEARALAEAGAEELDIGVRIGLLKDGDEAAFRDDIRSVVEAVGPVPVKVMLELPLLTPAQRERAVALAVEAGVRYVKNASSGAVGVATPDDIAFLRARVPATVGVKASGGIRTYEHVLALLAAGADLVGTSAGVAILAGAPPASVTVARTTY
jgi:deoxyribose-phosphate aldolase